VEVQSFEDVITLLQKAKKNRICQSTDLNIVSSRSHMIVTFTINIMTHNGWIKTAKLNLVDLAGSERLKISKAEGQRLKEACHINLSLFNLTKIVHQLEKCEKKTVLSYRNSKLTMLLKDSIGGNCLTTLIACISPT